MYQPWIETDPRLTRRIVESGALASSPLRVIDGGARHGVEPHWGAFGQGIELLAFEPEAEECARLERAALAQGGPPRRYFPVALGGETGDQTLHVARFPDSSSLLPVAARAERFGMVGHMEQIGMVEVPTVDLDSFLAKEGVPYVDFLKLDVEGVELDVLRAAASVVEQHLLGASIEVFFDTIHPGQGLFSEIDEFMRGRGFALFDLRDLKRWRRKTLSGDSEATWIGQGQLMYANALYLRDLTRADAVDGFERSRVALLKLASLAEIFCYPDYSVELLDLALRGQQISEQEHRELVEPLRQAAAPERARRLWLRRLLQRIVPARVRRKAMNFLSGVAEG